MKRVRQIDIRHGMTVSELTDEFLKAGVIGAGRVGKAADIVAEMFSNPDYTVFLAISGPLVPSGLRRVFVHLIGERHIDALMTNGANIVHDLIESMGEHHYKGSVNVDDDELYKKGINRIYDIFVKSGSFIGLEGFVGGILDDIPKAIRENAPIHELLKEMGSRIEDEDSILYNAYKHGVPIFCPGIHDSMLGIPFWMYSKRETLRINPLKDFDKLSDMVYKAEKSGAIILGGGMPKHHTQYLHTLRGGLDAAIQITSARAEDGSLSGAPLRESISWGKLKGEMMEMTSSIWGDVTIIFPLIIAAAIEKINKSIYR
ncbi:MAG: deoxyhypusine synthase [Candidatus Bathyarchaeia archaeon]